MKRWIALIFVMGSLCLMGCSSTTAILEKPPELTVVSGSNSVGALLGTYSWQATNSDGMSMGIEADSVHPLKNQDFLTPLETTKKTAKLDFLEKPDSILAVRCWSDTHWGDYTASSEAVVFSGNTIELKPGGYIYEIEAQWDAGRGYDGIAYYSVYIKAV